MKPLYTCLLALACISLLALGGHDLFNGHPWWGGISLIIASACWLVVLKLWRVKL